MSLTACTECGQFCALPATSVGLFFKCDDCLHALALKTFVPLCPLCSEAPAIIWCRLCQRCDAALNGQFVTTTFAVTLQ